MKNILDFFTSPHVLDAEENSYKPFNIFRTLLEYFNDQISHRDKILLVVHFEKYEHCLKLARTRNLASASLILEHINKLETNFPPQLHQGMNSLYSAMLAYYEYAHARYDKALCLLDDAIQCAKMQARIFVPMIGSIGEQWLNKVRVYLKIRDITSVLKETKELFLFCITGNHSDKEIETLYKALPYDKQKLMLDHVVNSIGEGISNSFTNDQTCENLYADIFLFLKPYLKPPATSLCNDTATICDVLTYYYNGDYQKFCNSIYNEFSSLRKSPKLLQKLVLRYYIAITEETGLHLLHHQNFNHFQKVCEELKLNIRVFETEWQN